MLIKIGIGAVLVLALLAGGGWVGYDLGSSHVQHAWNAAKTKAQTASQHHTQQVEESSHAAAVDYIHALTTLAPQVAPSVSAGVAGGTLQLRDNPTCAGNVPAATARARAADAAATQALADRIAHSIAAVRAGDAADARERQLGAQVRALQAIVKADRQEY